MVDIAALKSVLLYDPETGKLFWLERGVELFSTERDCKAWNTSNSGNEAFKAELNGYRTGTVFGWKTYAHRVIWALVHGELPKHCIDHINGDRSDNRICNLREATSAQNAKNSSIYSNNVVGFKGVSRKRDKWEARIANEGKKFHLGVFSTPEEAHAAYCEAAARLHREFARVA